MQTARHPSLTARLASSSAALLPIPGDVVRHVARAPGPKARYYEVTGEYLGGVDLRLLHRTGGAAIQATTPASLDDVAVVRTNWALRLFRCLIVVAAAVAERARRGRADRDARLLMSIERGVAATTEQEELQADDLCPRCGEPTHTSECNDDGVCIDCLGDEAILPEDVDGGDA